MKFQRFVVITGIFTSIWIADAAPESARNSNVAPVEKSLETLIQELSDDRYKIREEASQKLWRMGSSALTELEKAITGKDPESAYRARELMRKIQLRITPETDSGVLALIENYEKGTTNEKIGLLGQLKLKRAYWQMLRLYGSEKDVNVRNRMQEEIVQVAVFAAREELQLGNANEARGLLEMAPANAAGLLALADFHWSQGTLEAELKRAKTLNDAKSAAWQLALHRASGNIEAARDTAIAAQEFGISAMMSALLGDPLPWLERKKGDGADGDEDESSFTLYNDLAIKRLQGKPMLPQDLNPLIIAASRANSYTSRPAMSALFLLGETKAAEKEHKPSFDAFSYYGSTERVPEELKAIGLDMEKTDYSAWVGERVKKFITDEAPEEGEEIEIQLSATAQLLALGNFFEERGMLDEFRTAFLKPLEDLAKADEDKFMKFLQLLMSGMPGQIGGAPECARIAVAAWAGEDAKRWENAVSEIFGEQGVVSPIWDWLPELDPKASHQERFDGILALFYDSSSALSELREKWVSLAWQQTEAAPQEKRIEKLSRLLNLFLRSSGTGYYSSDSAMTLKIWERFPEECLKIFPLQVHVYDLSVAQRWNELADLILNEIEKSQKSGQKFSLIWHARAAGSLRQAGRLAEATAQDRLIQKLALGNDAAEIAAGYAFAYDYERAADWQARAVIQTDPESPEFHETLEEYLNFLKNDGNWHLVASVSEVYADKLLSSREGMANLAFLGVRFQADFARAMALVKKDRATAVIQLEKCYQMFPSDGALADDFFPALRKAGLIKEHDEWFQKSWTRMLAICEKFPNADNSLNTTAWLASRAQRNLDEAEKLQTQVLRLAPKHSAYLDTMAEVHFAKGNRRKAVEFSNRALNFLSVEPMMRRQHERFRSGPLPR